MKEIDIVECTLRDGSYIINYQFTAEDTAVIALALEKVGFRYIEIGHGVGLNASSCKGKAAETDKVYLKTAQEVLTRAKYGMFFIPGIGRKEDLDLAAEYGMGFVRIGTDVTEAESAEKYIGYAKRLGMMVSSNLMKSYTLPPQEFAKRAKLVEEFGADVVVLVDSAGGMVPEDIRTYIEAMKRAGVTVKIGFHGHNNFSMSVANTLMAIENGATIVDSTLMGIGRSAGNTPTEILVTIFKKLGYKLDVDIFKTMDIAEGLIKPIMKIRGGTNPIDIIAGYAEFHSSFLSTIYEASKKYRIDPRRLIISICEKEKVHVSKELATELAKQLHEERAAISEISRIELPTKFKISEDKWHSKTPLQEKSRIIANYIKNLSIKKGKQTIFAVNISAVYKELNIVLPYIYETSSYLMATCEMTDIDSIVKVAREIDGIVDFIVVDDEKKRKDLYTILKLVRESVKRSVVLTYKGNKTWAESIDYLISTLRGDLFGSKIGIVGINDTAIKLSISLSERGAHVVIFSDNTVDNIIKSLNEVKIQTAPFEIKGTDKKDELSIDADVLVGLRRNRIDKDMVVNMNRDGVIIDAVFGALTTDAIQLAQEYRIKMLRGDIKAAMAGEMTTVLRTYNLLKSMGKSYIAGIPIITPTYIGKKGDIIVDSILNPTQVIGVANGEGHVVYDSDEYKEAMGKIRMEILRRRVEGKYPKKEEE